MLRHPTVLPAAVTLDRVHAAFASAHVHMVVLTEHGQVGDRLVGTLLRTDLPATLLPRFDEGTAQPVPSSVPSVVKSAAGSLPAVTCARLLDRTIHADEPAMSALRNLRARGRRRAAVVDDDMRLLGLLCVKRHGRGFCSDQDVIARRSDRDRDAAVPGSIPSQTSSPMSREASRVKGERWLTR